MEGLFTAPEKLVLLWCPGLSGLVAGVPLDAAGVSPGCRRMLPVCRWMPLDAAGVPPDVAGVEEACGGFRCAFDMGWVNLNKVINFC